MRLIVLSFAALAACDGQVLGAAGQGAVPDDPASPGAMPPEPPAVFVPAPLTLRRLTLPEYVNSVQAVVRGPADLPSTLEGIDRQGYDFTTIGAGQAVYSETGLELFQNAAFDVADQVFADAARRSALLGTCVPSAAGDPCVAAWLAATGRRAFRRPLTDDERSRYLTLIETVAGQFSDPLIGLKYATAALLGSPAFLFRAELGVPADDRPGALALRGFERASRLSYLLWQAPPDDGLLDAAQAGALDTPEGLDAAVDRLLADPRARPALLTFFREHFALDGLDALVKDPQAFPRFTPQLGQSMQGELMRVLEDLVFDRGADFRELFTTRQTFVDTPLRGLYGLPAATGWQKTSFPPDGDRAGLLGFAGVLAAQAHAVSTSPTERGKFVRERLLGQRISPPPANVDVTAFQTMSDGQPHTMRERLAGHAAQACAGCHGLTDPPGLGLEHFDALGQYQADDHGLPLDTAEVLDDQPFDGPGQIGALLARDGRVTRTLTRELYQYGVGHFATAGEAVAISRLHDDFAAAGYRVLPLVRALVHSEGFLYAAP